MIGYKSILIVFDCHSFILMCCHFLPGSCYIQINVCQDYVCPVSCYIELNKQNHNGEVVSFCFLPGPYGHARGAHWQAMIHLVRGPYQLRDRGLFHQC